MYEGYLSQRNGGRQGIQYQVQNLFKYVESLPECAAFVREGKSGLYTPRGKNWLNTKIHDYLVSTAKKAGGGRKK